jgi:hypothetical protein
METRTITQVKIYYLIMNPVTDRAESGVINVMSLEKDRLVSFYNNEFVEPYKDDRFHKVFRQGGLLEWYNRLSSLEGLDHFGHGLKEEWIDLDDLENIKNQYKFI